MLLADLRGQRTLAAIVFTDGVSFSARMAEAEEHTLNLIRRDFQLMTELCEQFEGQVIKTTGDGLLLYFTSGVQAVACAQEIQKALAEAAAQRLPQDVLDHRIGIHLGDVFFSGTDVMGDGVNIAARLQAEAEPRGICISQTVYDVVKHRLTLTATYLGLRELKNIQAAVPVYQILPSQSEWSSDAIATVQPPAPKNCQPSCSRQESQNRQRLLTEVKSEVEARLSYSLHQATLSNSPEASRLTRRSWDIEVKIGKQPSCKLPSWAKAIQVFDTEEIAGKLLILGAPGAGKTTTLLELAGQLVVRAENEPVQPIPVLLSLSSWKDDKQTIADWLVAELKLKYGVRADVSKQWLDSQQLLPLLDGLDEVKTRQQQCIQAINQFLQDGRSRHLVVCCRRVEYVQSKTHLRLNGAIRLQPLSEEQIHQYVVNAARPELWHKLEADLCLMELAQSPLLLSMMTLIYQDPLQQWSQFSSIKQRRQYLFDAYVQTMLERIIKQRWYGPFKEPTARQTLRRLSWLARSLTQTSQTEFLIDEMQPTLLDHSSLRIYRMGVGLFFGLIVGLHNGLIVGQDGGLLGALSGIIVMLIAVIGYGLIAELHERLFRKVFDGPILGLSDNLMSGLMSGLIVGPIGGLTYWLLEGLVRPRDGFIEVIVGLLYGLVGGVIVGLSEKITTVESLKWSRIRAWKGLVTGMIFGLMLGITGVVTVKQSQGPVIVLTVGLIGVLMGGLVGGLVGPDVERRASPNQGIWLSAINAGVLAAIGGLMGGILDELTGKRIWGLTVGLISGLIPGMACIQYFVLRSSLWLNGSMPWNYVRFLNYATERLFLQRVGGRYRFIHNLLREHFAQLPLN